MNNQLNDQTKSPLHTEQHQALYAAFTSKDRRFDGRFFVGVTSTGIYCRPVCTARMPKAENCRFFRTAAEAEQAGFRPCLTCRPELAPGLSPVDAKTSLARRAAAYLEAHCGENISLAELSHKLGYTSRHLRRVFLEEYRVSPVAYRQTCRLLLAKSLLTDTSLSIIDVALASGFGSLRRFNELFQSRYHLSPSAFRRHTTSASKKTTTITLALGYRPPYLWQQLLQFLEMRAIPGVETITANAYSRTVKMQTATGQTVCGWLTITACNNKNVLMVTVSESLLPCLPQLLGRVRRLFDLNSDPTAIAATLTSMNELIPDVFQEGLRVPGCFDPFELGVRAILGQQITVKAASTLAGKVAAAFGSPIASEIAGLNYTFPSAPDILALSGRIEDQLGPLGIIAVRARAIGALAQLICDGHLSFELCSDPEAAMQTLTAIPGIGPWTAQYIALRALGDPDILPATDLGIRKALGGRTPAAIRALAEPWKPWRSYATMALWHSLK